MSTPSQKAAGPGTPAGRGPAADRADERLVQSGGSPRDAVGNFVRKIRSGDLGMLPVISGLIIIWIIFQAQNSNFLSARNLVNLTQFSAAYGMLSIGIVLVLLLGEIDLSIGSVSGVGGSIVGTLLVYHHWSAVPAILVAALAGLVIGVVYGLIYTKFGVPSFVITLAGLLIFLGVQLHVLGKNGTVNLPEDSKLINFAVYDFLSPTVAYLLAVVAGLLYFGGRFLTISRRRRANLSAPSLLSVAIRAVLLVVGLAVAAWALQRDDAQGVGYMTLLWVVVIVVMDLVLRRTTWGRHVYAVGGNEEAARRSGIRVDFVYISVFGLCSLFAAVGGVLAAGQLQAVAQSSGGTDTNLNAIAAAVIGGTSLFGGRGSMYSALFGVLVLQSITNGLNLVGVDAEVRYMITGLVLLLAVTIDSLSRRARRSSGSA